MTQFVAHGGIVQFSIEDQPAHFDINLDAASRARFEIRSKLLAFARIVRNQCSETELEGQIAQTGSSALNCSR
jgi:YfiR/HmsC-like